MAAINALLSRVGGTGRRKTIVSGILYHLPVLILSLLIFAMASLSLVPVFAIFVFFQKYLVRGISTTGLTG